VQVRARELSILLLLKPALPIRTYTERYGHAVQSLVEVDVLAAVFCSSSRAEHREHRLPAFRGSHSSARYLFRSSPFVEFLGYFQPVDAISLRSSNNAR